MPVTRPYPAYLPREINLPSHRAWVSREQEQFAALKQEFAKWTESLTFVQGMFKTHVYENPEADEFDYRQHRFRLCGLIAMGEGLYFEFLESGNTEEVAPYIAFIQSNVDMLFQKLVEWHFPTDFKDPVPDSFKAGMADVATGKVVDIDKALTEQP